MLEWAEELGAEATTVTELLEEDNEEVGLVYMLLLEEIDFVEIHILFKGEAGDNGPDPESQPESNFQRSKGKSRSIEFYFLILLFRYTIFLFPFSGTQVYDRAKRLFTAGRGTYANNETEEAHCDGDV